MWELIGSGLLSLAASSVFIKVVMHARPRPVPMLVMSEERRRRAVERLFVERLYDQHDRRQ
jgi:hypothetical protein